MSRDAKTAAVNRILDLIEAMKKLQSDVAEALSTIENRKLSAGALRRAHILAIGHMSEFFSRTSASATLVPMLDGLGMMLHDLDRGFVHPMLQGKKLVGRSPDAMNVWLSRAYAAAGIQCLILSGMRKNEAVNFAIKKYRFLSRLLRPGANARSSVSSWHDNFMKRKVGKVNKLALAWFDSHRASDFLDVSTTQIHPERFRDRALHFLAGASAGAEALVRPHSTDKGDE